MPSVYYTPKRSPSPKRKSPKKLPMNATLMNFFGPLIGARVARGVKNQKRRRYSS